MKYSRKISCFGTSMTYENICRDRHRAYMEHIETERKKELKKRCSNAELEEMKKKKEEESRKVEKLKSSMKD